MKRKIIMTWAGLVLVGALLVSCGWKTAPIPPQAVIPAPVADLVYQLDEKGVILSWSPPSQAEMGGPLPVIDRFLVEGAEYDLRDFCENCPVRYAEKAVVEAVPDQRIVTYREEGLQPGHVYFYRVKTSVGWRVVSRPSEPVSFRWQLPMGAPPELHSQVGDRQIFLSWQQPSGDLDGGAVMEPLLYEVYRSVAGGTFVPLGRPRSERSFQDQQLENGVSYRYKVRATRSSGGTGIFSATQELVPRDMTPPPTPQGLSVIITPDGSRIFWEPLVLADLGGYLILRRCEDSHPDEEFKVIGRTAAAATSFVDKTLKDQETCYYALKAFDLAKPANESSLSAQIKIKRNR